MKYLISSLGLMMVMLVMSSWVFSVLQCQYLANVHSQHPSFLLLMLLSLLLNKTSQNEGTVPALIMPKSNSFLSFVIKDRSLLLIVVMLRLEYAYVVLLRKRCLFLLIVQYFLNNMNYFY